MKTENGVTTYYIYGLGLIYETTATDCKVYHYDYRGSTVALTNLQGSVTDTFTYDTYGKLTTRTGTSSTQFLYNGRDGVMTDENGLVYMRARYYSPTLKRFINADALHGSISNPQSLNRYAYVNGDPVSYIDPTGYIGILALMGIGALIGAAVGAIGSIVSQSVTSKISEKEVEIDWGEVVADAAWGAVDGAISFSPLKGAKLIFAGVAASVGSNLTNELIDDQEGVDFYRLASSVVFDTAFDSLDLGINLTRKASYGDALESVTKRISRENRRKNRDYAAKSINRITEDFMNFVELKRVEYIVSKGLSSAASTLFEEGYNAISANLTTARAK